MIKLLTAPYPFYENSIQGLKICLGIGVFILSFCVFFEPFGLAEISTPRQIGYGVVSFVVCGFYIVLLPLIFNNQLRNEGWKIYKEILWVSLITISLGLANYYYSGFAFDKVHPFDLKSFLIVLAYTAVIAIIPAITIILYKQLFVYKNIVKEVKKIDDKLVAQNRYLNSNTVLKKLVFNSEITKDLFELNTNEFLFVASSGNYVEIYSSNGNGIQKKLIRNNISKIEKQVQKFDRFVRCHRSYIVNLDKISHVTGNLQGYQLFFEHIDWQIPVSRSYTKIIKSKILHTK
jgi:hypothetical protein